MIFLNTTSASTENLVCLPSTIFSVGFYRCHVLSLSSCPCSGLLFCSCPPGFLKSHKRKSIFWLLRPLIVHPFQRFLITRGTPQTPHSAPWGRVTRSTRSIMCIGKPSCIGKMCWRTYRVPRMAHQGSFFWMSYHHWCKPCHTIIGAKPRLAGGYQL